MYCCLPYLCHSKACTIHWLPITSLYFRGGARRRHAVEVKVCRHALVHAKTRRVLRSASQSQTRFIDSRQTESRTAPPRHPIMADLNNLFAPSFIDGLPSDIMAELESILRLYSISPQEAFYKWESYSLKMGSEDTKLDLDTVRMFKKDVQDSLERDTQGKHVGRGSDRKGKVGATPRGATSGGDVFGMQVSTNWVPMLNADGGLQA